MRGSLLTGWFRREAWGAPPSLPAGLRVYAIGDIHGRYDLLEALYADIGGDIERAPPERSIEDTQHHILVVAEEADPLVRGPPTKDQPLYDIARLRTAVDVVAQENLDAALGRQPL